MSVRPSILAADYAATPYWWEAFTPPERDTTLGRSHVDVAVIGAGYAGTCCALTLAEAGVDVAVFESGRLGEGASTRSGGQLSGGVNVQKKALTARAERAEESAARLAARLRDAAASMTYVEDLITRHNIDCSWHKTGRITVMWTPAHYRAWMARIGPLNEHTGADASMLSPEDLSRELGSNIYHGGALVRRGGHLHPALLYGGMLAAAETAGAHFVSNSPVLRIERTQNGYVLKMAKGDIHADMVVVATNGYTGSLMPNVRRRVLPITSHMIATEELPGDLARSILPTNRAISESRRVVNHYRLSPDGKRLLFGGRARFTPTRAETTAELLHRNMVQRFPQMRDVKVTHSWGGNVAMTFDSMPHIGGAEGLYYALGCNGSGVAMMSYLGHSVARKILSRAERINAFDTGPMPQHPLYFGTPWFLFAVGSWYQFLDARDKKTQ